MAPSRCRHLAWKMNREGKELHQVVKLIALRPAELMSAWKRSDSQVDCWLVGITLVVGEFEIVGKVGEDCGIIG